MTAAAVAGSRNHRCQRHPNKAQTRLIHYLTITASRNIDNSGCRSSTSGIDPYLICFSSRAWAVATNSIHIISVTARPPHSAIAEQRASQQAALRQTASGSSLPLGNSSFHHGFHVLGPLLIEEMPICSGLPNRGCSFAGGASQQFDLGQGPGQSLSVEEHSKGIHSHTCTVPSWNASSIYSAIEQV